MSYFRDVLFGTIEQIIKVYDGKEIEDKYSYNKFENGKWLVKDKEIKEDIFHEMIWKTLCTSDLACEIEVLTEGIIKSEICIIGISISDSNII